MGVSSGDSLSGDREMRGVAVRDSGSYPLDLDDVGVRGAFGEGISTGGDGARPIDCLYGPGDRGFQMRGGA